MSRQKPLNLSTHTDAEDVHMLNRRDMLKSTAALLGPSAIAGMLPTQPTLASAPTVAQAAAQPERRIGFVLSHEQFDAPQLLTYFRGYRYSSAQA